MSQTFPADKEKFLPGIFVYREKPERVRFEIRKEQQ